jgi:hypothetical protein
MDLALTRRGDYAVRAALCLARAAGDGGYRLTRPPGEVALLEASERIPGGGFPRT